MRAMSLFRQLALSFFSDAAEDSYAGCISGYIRWLAGKMPGLRARSPSSSPRWSGSGRPAEGAHAQGVEGIPGQFVLRLKYFSLAVRRGRSSLRNAIIFCRGRQRAD